MDKINEVVVSAATSSAWGHASNWRERYSKLYGSRGISLTKPQDEPQRVSFMSSDPYPQAHPVGILALHRDEQPSRQDSALSYSGSYAGRSQPADLGEHSTRLLDMVRKRNHELEDEALDQPLDLPGDDCSDTQSMDACVHGLSLRHNPETSVSRSRISRISTRRDMDIPSILAFTTNISAQVPLENPAFQRLRTPPSEEIPRWSIRRAVCPVCSQKWRDRTSIENVKNSGLKRNSSLDLPSVIAPARLRTSITIGYMPRPAQAALDAEAGMGQSGLRSTSASWQLSRARRFRTPRRAPHDTSAPHTASDAEEIKSRVSRFLTQHVEE